MTELATRNRADSPHTEVEQDDPMPTAQAVELSGAQLLIELLERQGVTCIAGVPGGANLPMYDALSGSCLLYTSDAADE